QQGELGNRFERGRSVDAALAEVIVVICAVQQVRRARLACSAGGGVQVHPLGHRRRQKRKVEYIACQQRGVSDCIGGDRRRKVRGRGLYEHGRFFHVHRG